MKLLKRLFILVLVVLCLPINVHVLALNSELSIEDNPEAINDELIQKKSHIKRLRQHETDLNTIVFSNENGSQTMYNFSIPVKYQGTDNQIIDKSNKLYEVNNQYSETYAVFNKYNDVNIYFPKNISSTSGIKLQYNNYELDLMPNITNHTGITVSKSTGKQPDTVSYLNLVPDYLNLTCSTNFNGYDLITQFINPVDNISFILNTHGLHPIIKDEVIYLTDPHTNQVVAAFNFYSNNVLRSHLTKLQDSIYEFNLSLDPNIFENNPLPVSNKFSITILANSDNKQILDVPIYSGNDAKGKACGADYNNYTGYIAKINGEHYGVGRTLIRFPGLLNNPKFVNIPAQNITDLTLHYYELSKNFSESSINTYYYQGNVWDEYTATYNNTWFNGTGDLIDTQKIKGYGLYKVEMNLTSAVEIWKNDNTVAEKGIVFVNNSETSSSLVKNFQSTESSNPPFLTMDYYFYGCKPYDEKKGIEFEDINCHAYACFMNNKLLFMDSSDNAYLLDKNKTTDQILQYTKLKFEEWLSLEKTFQYRWKEVSSVYPPLNENQWLICMRIGRKPKVNMPSKLNYDYHFWYRTNTGVWAHKPGSTDSKLLDKNDHPENNNSPAWVNEGYSPFYDSNIIYYVLTEKE